MNQELRDKEVICIYDVRAIQNYIFSNNNNIDIIGAGELVKDIHLESFQRALAQSGLKEEEYCLKEWENEREVSYDVPFFYDPKIKAQLVTIGGGNAFMLFRTGEIADKVNKIYSRCLLEFSYSLQVAVAMTKRTDNFAQDINHLYDELTKVKNMQPFFHPLGTLPIVEKEKDTGNPVHLIDPETGEHISLETAKKREYARKGLGEDIRSSMAAIGTYHKTLAYIHIDGNGFGLAIGRIFAKMTDYEEGVKARRKLNANIMLQYLASLDESEVELKKLMTAEGIPEEWFSRYYQRINIGGDDVNVVCSPKYAFRFVSIFEKIVTKKYLWNDESVGAIKFSVCAGIAFVDSSIEYCQGYQLAEQCCGEAKKEAKKPCNSLHGEIGNWVDYQIVRDRRLEDISTQRDRDFSFPSADLCLRPYCLDPERKGTLTHISQLRSLFEAFNTYLPASLKWRLLDIISEDPTMAQAGLENILLQMRDDERELMKKHLLPKLGEPLVSIEGRSTPCSHWYDALELGTISDWDKIMAPSEFDLGE